MAVKKQIEKWQEAYPQLYAQLYPPKPEQAGTIPTTALGGD